MFYIIQRIAYRIFQARERLGIIGRTEAERAGLEKQDWFLAEKECLQLTK